MVKDWFLATELLRDALVIMAPTSSVDESLMYGFIDGEAVREMGNMWRNWVTRSISPKGLYCLCLFLSASCLT